MLIGEILNVALGALRANKLRSLLTMLGVVIGVGAVIAMVAIGSGAQEQIQARIAALGTTLLTVNPNMQRGGGGVTSADQAPLEVDDYIALRDSSQYIAAVQPEMRRNLTLQFGSKNANPPIIGTTANYLEVRNFKIAKGRKQSVPELMRSIYGQSASNGPRATWQDFREPPRPPPRPKRPPRLKPLLDALEAMFERDDFDDLFTDWEQRFICDLLDKYDSDDELSPSQVTVIRRLQAKVRRRDAEPLI